jgi:uncharacterized protein
MPTHYRTRVVDEEVRRSLDEIGAILLEGPRACGKTATGQFHAKSSVRLDVDSDARALASIDPALILDGPVPRLIDEWQLEPQLWNHVRRAVDDRQEPGQFILAGSSVPADDATRHAGAGRILRIRMRPMSLFESGHSSGEVSLASVLHGATVGGTKSPLTLAGVTSRMCIGGWPALQDLSPSGAQRVLAAYLDDVARVDVPALDGGRRRDASRIKRVIASVARNVATEVSIARIAADAGEDSRGVSTDTVRGYLDALTRVMVIEDQPSWGAQLRSRDIVRKASKRHFVDPSLAAAALGASPDKLLKDPNTLGFLFESLVIRDLRVYAQAANAEVRHFRDSSGTEVDAIITLPNGDWAAIEVKLGASQADAAAASLDAFVRKVDLAKSGPPKARIVVTAGEYAFTRPDGAIVVPLGCLGP